MGEGGEIKAAFAEVPVHRLPVPLVLKPAAKAEYFDVRSHTFIQDLNAC